MKQHQHIVEEYLSLKKQIVALGSTELTQTQSALLQESQTIMARLEQLLIDDYVDFEEICDQLPDSIYIASVDGTTRYVNHTYSKLANVAAEDVIGINVHQLNKDGSLYRNGIAPKVLQTKQHCEQIGFMTRTSTTVHITGIPIFDDQNELKFAVACSRNIQQLETIKDQLLQLKESMAKKEGENAYLRTQQVGASELVFRSKEMLRAVSTALSVAPTDATVLIIGESGTGKEVIANQIYQASSRRGKPFLKINCAAIPENLMESELFGYEPGSFTGASKHGKTGIFELANGGTLMLDEIGEMSMPMQTKLLRVLQNQEIIKVGGGASIPVDTRIIAATNKDLEQAIEEGTFRKDLYYRLNVIPIHLMPLRHRPEDVEVLFYHFLEKYSKKYNKAIEVCSDALRLLENYPWPGNIRELENVTERMVVINQTNVINKNTMALALGIQNPDSFAQPDDEYDLKASTAALERHIIEKALMKFPTKRKAATALGIDHSTLVKKCQRYGLN